MSGSPVEIFANEAAENLRRSLPGPNSELHRSFGGGNQEPASMTIGIQLGPPGAGAGPGGSTWWE